MSKRTSYSARLPEINHGYFNPYEARLSPTQPQVKTIINDNPTVPDYPMLPNVTKRSSYNMKLVVVGDGGCGKTCMLVSYAQGKFPEIYVPTIFENYVACFQTPNGKTIELALWDTAGQEEYDRLRPLSYPDADLIAICFAVDNLVSLQNIKDMWYPEVNHFCPGVPVLLVGTKADLQLEIDPDLPIQLATEINAIGYIQCLAKTMFNVKTVFNFALNHFQKGKEFEEQVEKLRNRMSRVMGLGHKRNSSSKSFKKGHFPNKSSVGSSVLLDTPLVEDDYLPNPYQNGYRPQGRYNDEEFAFTRKTKSSRKCTIL